MPINADFVEVVAFEVMELQPDIIRVAGLPYVRMGDYQAFVERQLCLAEFMRMLRQVLSEADRETDCYDKVMKAAQVLYRSLSRDIEIAKRGDEGYYLTPKGYELTKPSKAY